jgi:ABC-type transporter Mla subunit MlaD
MTGGQLDFGTGLVGGNIVSVTPSANTTLTAGQTIKIELTKTTVGSGEALLVFCLTRN